MSAAAERIAEDGAGHVSRAFQQQMPFSMTEEEETELYNAILRVVIEAIKSGDSESA